MNSPARFLAANSPEPPGNPSPVPTVSLVICTRNRPAELRECLQAVCRLNPQPDEVVIIDNSTGNAETEHAAVQFGARYCLEPAPGLSRARNRGLREAHSAIVAFIDDDALPCEDWISRIRAPFTDKRIAAVTGDTVPDTSLLTAVRETPARTLSNADPLWFEMANFGGLGFGTNMSLRKEYCADEQFFDPRLGRGAPIWIAEESHAFTRLLACGYLAVHVPAAVVLHPDKNRVVEKEATASFAYWLLLFCEFPDHRRDLARFLGRRLLRKPLTWPRDPYGPGEIINSGLGIKLKSAFAGVRLYWSIRKR